MLQRNIRLLPGDGMLKSKENVKVLVRVKPETKSKLSKSENNVLEQASPKGKSKIENRGKLDSYPFTFDHIFDQHSSQSDVFKVAGIPTVENVLAGYNSTIIAYGEREVGKTYTIVGNLNNEEQQGLIPRVSEYLFKRIEEEKATQNPPPNYEVVYSNYEIYNETIIDSLNPNSTNLKIRDDTKFDSGVYVEGLKEVPVTCTKGVIKLMMEGMKNGTKSTNSGNTSFTNSIKIYSYFITRKEQSQLDGSEKTRVSRLILVDLASSERTKGTEMKDLETLRGICSLNSTHTTLKRVSDCLVERNSKPMTHIPYRDSKLTSLLQESLGGNARTTIIAGVSPMYSSSSESLSTLQFVQRAKHIKNKAKVNEVVKLDLLALQMEVMRLHAQIENMKKEGYRQDPNDRSSVSCTPKPDPELQNKIREYEEKIEELKAQLEEAQSESDRAADQNRRLESDNQYLRDLNTQLQTSINDMTTEFSVLQERLNEPEQITNNVLEAKCAVYEEKLEAERQLVLKKENEKQERDAKITKLEEESRDLVAKLSQIQTANSEIQSTLDITHAALNSNANELERLSKENATVKSALNVSVAKCEDLDLKLIEANGQVKDLQDQLASLLSELERTIAKSD